MTVDQLSCFLAVAEHKSFTEAAKHLYISHSAVSKAISSLEASLNVQLLVRDNRTVALTPAGTLLKERGSQLLFLWRDLEARISNIRNNETGSLSFILPVMNNGTLFALMQKMRELYPLVNLELHPNEMPLSICNSVMHGHTDFGVTYSYAIPEDTALAHIPVERDRFSVFTSYDHPFAGLPSVSLAEALRQIMVFPPLNSRENDSPLLHRIFRPSQSDDYSSQNLEECLLQVALGRGIAILPRSSVGPQYTVCSVPISDVIDSFTMDLLWDPQRTTPLMERFLSLAETQIDPEAL